MIVILGVLATVVVFAVGGIVDRGEVSALEGDARTIVSAEESHYALHGSYATETDLVSGGFLRAESSLHDVTVTPDGTDYTIAATAVESDTTTTVATPPPPPPDGGGDDGGGGGGGDGGGGSPTTTEPAPTTTVAAVPTGYAGFNGQATGSGSRTLVIIGRNGTGGTSTEALYTLLTTDPLPDTTVIWLDQADVNDTGDVDTIIAANPNYMVAADSVPITRTSGGSTFVGQYMDGLPGISSPSDFWWTHGQGRNPSRNELIAHL